VITDWWGKFESPNEAVGELRSPTKLVAALASSVQERYERSSGKVFRELSEDVRSTAYLQLPEIFSRTALPSTPQSFAPVPDVEMTIRARASAVLAIGALGMESVSYGSENDGELFVNLVVLPGEGRNVLKSKSGMRGHTDAVSFPFRGQVDPNNPSISPSPDFVCLSGLRNPDSVRTTIMPLNRVLEELSVDQIAELKKQQFDIRSQKTFIEGMTLILGEEYTVEDAEILLDVNGATWVRYSHSSIFVDEDVQPAAAGANSAFVAACSKHCESVVIEPGDIVLVNNRLALHGRTDVAGEPGGESRWILRTYGLETSTLTEAQRYAKPSYMLYP